MTIKITCQCGKRLAVQTRLAGKRIKCPSCSATMTVPKFGDSKTEPSEKQDAVVNPGLANWFDVQLPSVSPATAPEAINNLRTLPHTEEQHGPRCSKCNGTLLPLSLFSRQRTCGRCEIDLYLVNSQNCISSAWLLRAGRNEPGHDRERIKDFRLLIIDAAEAVRESSDESSRYSRRFGGTTIIELVLWNVLSTNVHRRELRHMKILLSLFHKQTGYEFATWAENPSRWIPFLSSFQRRA
jgi:hypothetical protein